MFDAIPNEAPIQMPTNTHTYRHTISSLDKLYNIIQAYIFK